LRRRRPTEEQPETFWALKDVSFKVQPGEVLGIIGRNGAGKSTLLKILTRVVEPTSGRVEMRGRMGSLLEVGTGFHPELTGRENVYLNGSFLGMSRKEIDRKFDEIVAFSEIEKFLDTPVKRYSSGMYVRLAFAVAAHLESEILVLDEVLAVGDAEFQQKCLGKMSEVTRQGRTVLFVSHNTNAILNICSRALLFESGRVVLDDRPTRVFDSYLAIDRECNVFQPDRGRRSGTHRALIEGFTVGPTPLRTGMPVEFVFDITCPESATRPFSVELGGGILTERGDKIAELFSRNQGVCFQVRPGKHRFVGTIDSLLLVPGRYRLNLWMGSGPSHAIDFIEDCVLLNVLPGYLGGDVIVENCGFPVQFPMSWAGEGIRLPLGR
jgi:lipopolysaccharide transport system ATP-binding protein